MSFHAPYDIDPDNASIRDVLLCWESGEDDDDIDSIHMVPKVGDLLDSIVNVIPESPRVISPPNMQETGRGTLERLILKYPSFVPRSIPKIPLKRHRPLCLFINYMGSRDVSKDIKIGTPKATEVDSKIVDPSPYPTDAPSFAPRPAKKLRTLPSTFPCNVTGGTHRSDQMIDVSPMPTLGPTTTTKPVSPRH